MNGCVDNHTGPGRPWKRGSQFTPATLLPTASFADENTESWREMYSGQAHRTRKGARRDLDPGRWPAGQRYVRKLRVLAQLWVHLGENAYGGHAFTLFPLEPVKTFVLQTAEAYSPLLF